MSVMQKLRTLFVVGCGFGIFCECVPHDKKKEAQPLVDFFSYSNILSRDVERFIQTIADAWEKHSEHPNLHNMGARALVLWTPGAWFYPTYAADEKSLAQTRFLNLGQDGFLVAQLNVQGQLNLVKIFSRYNLPAPPEATTQAEVSSVPDEWQKTLAPEAMALATTPVLGSPSTCSPMGVHSSQETYFLQPKEHLGCVFFRSPSDMRFVGENFRSKLACFNTKSGYYWNTNLDKTQFLFSVSPTKIASYEGAYAPPRMTQLDLETGEQTEVPRKPALFLNSDHGKDAVIPETPMAVYLCQSQLARISKNDVVETTQSSYFLEDADIYLGKRLPKTNFNHVWHAHVDEEFNLRVEQLDWSQAVALSSGFSAFPLPLCSLAQPVDVKCALSNLQMAANLSFEILAGRVTPESIRWQKAAVAFALLRNVSQKMGDWLLEEEVWRFLQLFAQELKNATAQPLLPQTELRFVKEFLELEEPNFEIKNQEERKALRSYLAVPPEFWNALLRPQ